jgi:hypothetical protein
MSARLPGRRARQILAALLGAVIPPAAAAAAAAIATCTTWPLAEGAFSACFPGSDAPAVAAAGADARVRLWAKGTAEASYLAIAAPLAGMPASAATRMMAALNANVIATKAGAFAGLPGRPALRFWFALPAKRHGEGVVVGAGGRLYGLVAVMGAEDERIAARFLASLAIPASAKAAESLMPQQRSEAAPAARALAERIAAAMRAAPGTVEAANDAPLRLPARPRQVALAETRSADDLPDPHADLEAQRAPMRERAQPLGKTPLAAAPATPRPAAPRAQPVDPSPMLLEDPPSPRALPPRPPSIGWPAAGAPVSPPPTHRIWLPGAWRWNGYSWEWLPGHWDRARN